MNKKTTKNKLKEGPSIKLPRARRQKTVHSTFRLSAEAHNAIKEFGTIYGYGKHADIFDRFEELIKNNFEAIKIRVEIYNNIQRNIAADEVPQGLTPEIFASKICFDDFAEKIAKVKTCEKIRKTYVLKKEIVELLKKYRNEFEKVKLKINRDELIEILALTFKEELYKERTKTTGIYKRYLGMIESVWNELESLDANAVSELSYDPFDLMGKIRYEADGLMNLHQDLESFLTEEMKNDNDGTC